MMTYVLLSDSFWVHILLENFQMYLRVEFGWSCVLLKRLVSVISWTKIKGTFYLFALFLSLFSIFHGFRWLTDKPQFITVQLVHALLWNTWKGSLKSIFKRSWKWRECSTISTIPEFMRASISSLQLGMRKFFLGWCHYLRISEIVKFSFIVISLTVFFSLHLLLDWRHSIWQRFENWQNVWMLYLW